MGRERVMETSNRSGERRMSRVCAGWRRRVMDNVRGALAVGGEASSGGSSRPR